MNDKFSTILFYCNVIQMTVFNKVGIICCVKLFVIKKCPIRCYKFSLKTYSIYKCSLLCSIVFIIVLHYCVEPCFYYVCPKSGEYFCHFTHQFLSRQILNIFLQFPLANFFYFHLDLLPSFNFTFLLFRPSILLLLLCSS